MRFGLGLLGLGLALGLSACGNARVTAPLPPLANITVTPAADTVQIGESAGFQATAFDSSGRAVSGVAFNWSTSDPAVATVSVLGVGTGVGEGNAMLIVTAGGVSDTVNLHVIPTQRGWFTQVSNASGAALYGVTFRPDGRTGWAVGETGKILVTHDAGHDWSPQTSSTTFRLNAVWFVNDSTGFVAGLNGTVLHTANGGRDWDRLNTGTSQGLMDVCFVNDSLGFVVGSFGLILKTLDGGVNWSPTNLTQFTYNGVSFANDLEGWAVGDFGVIAGTHDGGATWFVVQPAVTGQNLQSVWRRSADLGFAVGDGGVAPRTIVGPDSVKWEIRNTNASQLYGVHFPTDLIGYAAGFNGTGAILRTANGGASWTAQTAPTGFQLHDIFFVGTDRGWAVGDNGTILHTATGGEP
jgi:photosystem II stability/assembly factor-like uncharacterized protein